MLSQYMLKERPDLVTSLLKVHASVMNSFGFGAQSEPYILTTENFK